ncbi:hypothetical protein [Pontibacter indicus]|nr:hypothetical protein [Pontibacter indicus]
MAVSIVLFGLDSPAVLVCVVGMQYEVSGMFSLVAFANKKSLYKGINLPL